MTAAGVGSLLICQRQLAQYRDSMPERGPEQAPRPADGAASRAASYEVETTPARIEPAVKRGLAWLAGQLHDDERPGRRPVDLLRPLRHRADRRPGRPRHARPDRLVRARAAVHPVEPAGRTAPGTSTHGDGAEHRLGVLFLTRSTAKTLQRIEVKRLGAGTLLGRPGLPKDLSSLTVAGGRVVSRPMNGAVEGMLAVLEDPRAENADSALAGLVARYQAEGPGVLRPHKDRFRKLLTDRDPGLRQVAAWAPGADRRPRRRPRPDRRPGRPRRERGRDRPARASSCSAARSTGSGPPPPRRPSSGRRPRGGGGTGIERIRPLDLGGPGRRSPASAGPAPGGRDEPPDAATRRRTDADPGLRADGPRRVALRPGHLAPDGRRHRRLARRRLAGPDLRHEPGVRLAGDRPAADHRRLRRRRGEPRGDGGLDREDRRRRGRRSRRRPRTTRRRRPTSRSPRSRRRPPRCSTPWPRRARASPRSTSAPRCRSGGAVASGRRASKLGTGGPGLGFGPGDGGVPREQRWSIVYNPGQTPEEYARQLDALGVELAVVSGENQLTYVSHFSSPTPTKRFGSGQGDDRLYFLWQGRGRKASDVALLKKAGIDVGEGVVLQFYPKAGRGDARAARGPLPGQAARRDPRHPVQRRPPGGGLRLRGPRPGDLALSADSRLRPHRRARLTRRMATLEVHDGRGRVQRVTIARDQPVLFGSSPKCDIVLDDPEVLPFHGRLRWKRDRFKVDASPEAEFLEVNGRKMASSSFRQGDEIQVGSCRIFLIHDGRGPPRAARRRATTGRGSSPRRSSRRPTPARRGRRRPSSSPTPLVEPRGRAARPRSSGDWLEGPGGAPPPRRGRRPAAEPADPSAPSAAGRRERATAAAGRRLERGWGGLIRAFRREDRPPGEERILTSPLVVGLVVALVVLVAAERRALGDHPADGRVAALQPGGREPRTTATTATRSAASTTSSAGTRRRAGEQGAGPPRPGQRPPVHRDDGRLVVERPGGRAGDGRDGRRRAVVPRLEHRAGRAGAQDRRGPGRPRPASADARTLAEAESAVALHARVAGKAAGAFLARSRVPGKLAEARAAVRKAAIRAAALAAMDAALKAGSSAGVYAARDALVAPVRRPRRRPRPDRADDRGPTT